MTARCPNPGPGGPASGQETAMPVIDLTHPIRGGMPVYPGTPRVETRCLAAVDPDGFAEKQLVLTTHTGTHVDAPAHMLARGATLDASEPERFAGPAALLRVPPGTSGIGMAELAPMESLIRLSEFLIIHTGWSRFWGTEDYFSGYPVLTPEAAVWLSGFSLKGVGLDAVSADRVDTSGYPVHHALMTREILIVENLANLDLIAEKRFYFCSFPLKISGADGAPVRALAFTDGICPGWVRAAEKGDPWRAE